jgi:Spy/CpxP family protein refolding chaperone
MIGLLVGVLATNIYRDRISSLTRGGPGVGFEHLLDRMQLTPDQRTQVDAIFDDAREQLAELRKESEPKFREVRQRTDDRLKSVLTPEQWEQYKQMTDELRRGRPHRGPRRGGNRR